MSITAINPKYQSLVNRAVNWLTKYNELDNQRNVADSNGDDRLYAKLDKKCQNAFDKYLECAEELPSREQSQIEKSELY